MKKINVLSNNESTLEIHEDVRGLIADVFFAASINHVALIRSEPFAERGNHYHKNSTQSILITKGSLEYWYKDSRSDSEPQMVIANVGDLITSDPFEIHALRILENGNEFIAFTEGQRGGADYESDTFRVDSIFGK